MILDPDIARVRTNPVRPELAPIFEPFTFKNLTLRNRSAMSPMTRSGSPGGVPSSNATAYYERRAQGGAGLIFTEGAWVPHAAASDDDNVPNLFGAEALARWQETTARVHAHGAAMFPQLWHVGQVSKPRYDGQSPLGADGKIKTFGPSGLSGWLGEPIEQRGEPATESEIADVIAAFVAAARFSVAAGFDGVALHGAHGYVIDQFLWAQTNHRSDRYGGTMAGRNRFALELVAAVRAAVGPDFPIAMRLSQWKSHDYGATLANTPAELEQIVGPLADAGVDLFDMSQRRFWEGEFGTAINLAGWTKKLTGKAVMTVGSVSLDNSIFEMMSAGEGGKSADNLPLLAAMIERGEIDLFAVGRAFIANPDWTNRVAANAPLAPYSLDMLQSQA